jgi:NitT/TauT family transport system ATP-binding protein
VSEVLGPKLEISHLSKGFSRSASSAMPVLDDLSLAVADLEFVAIVGPSGCGKSTFLRIVDGLIPPDTGTIRLNGAPVNGPGHGRGMVFQSFDLFPWRTAIGNVEFGLEMQNLPRAERRRRAHHWIELVGLQGFENSYPHQLSGGMQQRVGIARALAIEPEVLLMDEPFGALDVQTRDLLQDELLAIWQRERKTVLFVTHSIEEAIYLADRVLVFTPRPARIERVVDVPFGRPRREDMKSDPGFVELRREIWQSLKHGVRI